MRSSPRASCLDPPCSFVDRPHLSRRDCHVARHGVCPPPEPVRYHRARRQGIGGCGRDTLRPRPCTPWCFSTPDTFHAALTLRERHPLVRDEIVVYAPTGPAGARGTPETVEFLDLVEAFNRRSQHPTSWQVVVRTADDPLARLLTERPGDVVILAGRNDRKMALMRALHDAGLHVLADKPWLTRAAALSDVRHVLGGGARVMEMMTGRHAGTAKVAERLLREPDVFGKLDTSDGPAIRLASVHHLEKSVNGAALRRPAW